MKSPLPAGESDGVDASMMIFRDLALEKIKMPEDVVVALIPVHIFGGTRNRNTKTGVNQNGPSSMDLFSLVIR